MARLLVQKPFDVARKGMNREALLEPIKLQRGMEKVANNPRKKEESETKRGVKVVTLHNGNKIYEGKTFQTEKGKIADEANQLDKSDITSDHEPPTCAENYLSDGTQSNLRPKRPLIFRIKLRKPSEPDASVACTTPSGRVDCLPQARPDTVVAPKQQQPSAETNARLEPELSCSKPVEIKEKSRKRHRSSSHDHIHKEASPYANLVENWVPPPLHLSFNDDGAEEWLFEKKHHGDGECGSKRYKPSNEVLGCRNSTLWPQAQLLPEVGVYALPFTVPF